MIAYGAETFFAGNGDKGVLLIHGFTGSPAEMRQLGMHLYGLGYTVLGLRLPGHGTTPENLERTTCEDWKNAVLDAYEILASQCRRVAVAGLSMGGLLALWLTTQRPVFAVVTLAAPVFLQEEDKLSQLPPREETAGSFMPRRHRLSPLYASRFICYNVMPLRSIYELLDLMAEVKQLLPEVKRPLLVLQGGQDRTVKLASANYIFTNCGSRKKEMLMLMESGHRMTMDGEPKKVEAAVACFLQRLMG